MERRSEVGRRKWEEDEGVKGLSRKRRKGGRAKMKEELGNVPSALRWWRRAGDDWMSRKRHGEECKWRGFARKDVTEYKWDSPSV